MFRWAVAVCTAGMMLVGVVVLFGKAIGHKQSEYAAVRRLAALDLPLSDAAMMMAMTKQTSGFDGHVAVPETRLGNRWDEYLAIRKTLLAEFHDLQDPEAFAAVGCHVGMARLRDLFSQGAPTDLKGFMEWTARAKEQERADRSRLQAEGAHLRRLVLLFDDYRTTLPGMMARKAPALVEYVEAGKTVLVEATAYPKWFMHLALGGLIFFMTIGLLLPFASLRQVLVIAFSTAFAVAVGLEIIDFYEALLNNKTFLVAGSLWDVLGTMSIPLVAGAAFLFPDLRGRVTAPRGGPHADTTGCSASAPKATRWRKS